MFKGAEGHCHHFRWAGLLVDVHDELQKYVAAARVLHPENSACVLADTHHVLCVDITLLTEIIGTVTCISRRHDFALLLHQTVGLLEKGKIRGRKENVGVRKNGLFLRAVT